MDKSRWSALAASLFAGMLTLTACSSAASAPGAVELRDGPLQSTSPHAWGIRQPLGATFTDGFETLEFSGDQDAKLVRVRLLGDPALELVGVGLATPDRRFSSVQLMKEFPPRHQDLAAAAVLDDGIGVPMAAKTRFDIGWELLLGIRVNEPGRHVRTGVEVTYTVGNETYVEVIPAALAICADPAVEEAVNDCKLPPLPETG